VRYRVWSRFSARTVAVPGQPGPAQPGPHQPRPQPQPHGPVPVQVQPAVARAQFTGRGVDERTAAVK